jgi:hypothetical protein
MLPKSLLHLWLGGLLAITACVAFAAGPNKVAGTWRLVSSVVDSEGSRTEIYGSTPNGQLIFSEGLRFVAVVHDPRIPRYASMDRSKGTAEENQAAVAGSLGVFGTYSVDANGDFAGFVIEGSTFPNFNGVRRSREGQSVTVDGDRMTETAHRAGGSKMINIWERVR